MPNSVLGEPEKTFQRQPLGIVAPFMAFLPFPGTGQRFFQRFLSKQTVMQSVVVIFVGENSGPVGNRLRNISGADSSQIWRRGSRPNQFCKVSGPVLGRSSFFLPAAGGQIPPGGPIPPWAAGRASVRSARRRHVPVIHLQFLLVFRLPSVYTESKCKKNRLFCGVSGAIL